MTVGQWILRVSIFVAIAGALLVLAPSWTIYVDSPQSTVPCWDTQADMSTAVCIPDAFWQPIVATMSLNEYLPTLTILTIFGFEIALRVAMVTWWASMWVWSKVAP